MAVFHRTKIQFGSILEKKVKGNLYRNISFRACLFIEFCSQMAIQRQRTYFYQELRLEIWIRIRRDSQQEKEGLKLSLKNNKNWQQVSKTMDSNNDSYIHLRHFLTKKKENKKKMIEATWHVDTMAQIVDSRLIHSYLQIIQFFLNVFSSPIGTESLRH